MVDCLTSIRIHIAIWLGLSSGTTQHGSGLVWRQHSEKHSSWAAWCHCSAFAEAFCIAFSAWWVIVSLIWRWSYAHQIHGKLYDIVVKAMKFHLSTLLYWSGRRFPPVARLILIALPNRNCMEIDWVSCQAINLQTYTADNLCSQSCFFNCKLCLRC